MTKVDLTEREETMLRELCRSHGAVELGGNQGDEVVPDENAMAALRELLLAAKEYTAQLVETQMTRSDYVDMAKAIRTADFGGMFDKEVHGDGKQ